MRPIFAEDLRDAPYWWDASPLNDPAQDAGRDLPAQTDAVVIGAGYTGLHAALQIARGGRSVVVLDAGALGQGCSTRNGGQISTSIKPELSALARRYGPATARRILADGHASRAFVERFIKQERLDCDFRVCGRFHGAHSPRAFERMRAALDRQPEEFALRATPVARQDQREEIGSDYYHGGVVYHDHAALDPARYHAGLVSLCRDAGAELHPVTRATRLVADARDVQVSTPRGTIRARDVVLATNGYTDALSPWHRRRIVPIGSYIIATEEIPAELMAALNPRGRIASDSRRVVYYYRSSPDGKRILFGGRVSAGETDTRSSGRRLHAEMARVFPQLADCRVTHSWMGYVGYSFDSLAHVGQKDHVHHAMGYCGSGVGMASYLGMRTGRAVLDTAGGATSADAGLEEDAEADALAGAETGLGRIGFPTRPFYRGRPWFLPAAVEFHRLKDRIGI